MTNKNLLIKALELSKADDLSEFITEVLSKYIESSNNEPDQPNVEKALVWKVSDRRYILKKGSILNKPSKSLLNHPTYSKYIKDYIEEGYLSEDGLEVKKDIEASGSSIYSYVLGYPTRPKVQDPKYGL